jgi:hypothetical protein
MEGVYVAIPGLNACSQDQPYMMCLVAYCFKEIEILKKEPTNCLTAANAPIKRFETG